MQHDFDKDRTNVFVKYLPPDIDSAGLHELFATYGKIVSAKVMVNQETGQSLGYGYVQKYKYHLLIDSCLFSFISSHSSRSAVQPAH